MHDKVRMSVKSLYDVKEDYMVKVGDHQGSAINPYLFLLMTDKFMKGVPDDKAPYCTMFANDMILVDKNTNK